MAAVSTVNLQEALQAEFSPSLDTSLIAAIVADYVSDPNKPPSEDQIKHLRKTLSDLAADAEFYVHDDVAGDLVNLRLTDTTEDSYDASTADFLFSESGATSTTGITSEFSNGVQSLTSPLRFLQTAFPHLPASRLKSALGGAESMDEIDMESVVESIMAAEYVRELEERGEEEGQITAEKSWETVPSRQVGRKQKRKAVKTITFGDVRQKQLARPSSTPNSPRAAASDPWTQLSSVAFHLETLIPHTTAMQFQSMFHSPQYSSPSEALRAALRAIVSPISPPAETTPEETQMLFGMFDILQESDVYQALSDIDRERMMSDAQLALCATQQHPDAALDVVWLLREVDAGQVDWGIYHSPAPSSPTISTNGRQSKFTTQLPSGPPPTAPPKAKTRMTAQSAPNSPLVHPAAWQTIPVTPRKTTNPHADFIPAYNNTGTKGSSSKVKSGAKNNPSSHKQRAGELMQKRREALREASRAWQRGNSLTRGGEVAFYFAERARELQERAQAEKFDATWDLVQSRRVDSETGSTIDLHGASVLEALQITRRILVESPATQAKPLKIITGRGLHSTSGVGVLGPAVKNALVEDGWNVDRWTGGLVVRGKVRP
ncbi:hypothetical protein BDY19DRAFT_974898 [Irpex rosettiformis]|uniref:Uncharacterized protein n=1 Tax=Irpex rosettiformis TaxID=378272 RepID=A0ACB8TPM6_9APHY|nr:hypothetical protein BDY19DRAFT_974898 [Irpex rosettiformis]